jgi:hypothetical protein
MRNREHASNLLSDLRAAYRSLSTQDRTEVVQGLRYISILQEVRSVIARQFRCSVDAVSLDFRWADKLDLEQQGLFLAEVDAAFEGKVFNAFISDEEVNRIAAVSQLATYIEGQLSKCRPTSATALSCDPHHESPNGCI